MGRPVTSSIGKLDNQWRVRTHADNIAGLKNNAADFLDPEKPSYMTFGLKGQIIIYSCGMFDSWKKALENATVSSERLPEGEKEQISLFLSSLVPCKISKTQNQVIINLPKTIRSSSKSPEKGEEVRIVADGVRFELWPADDLLDEVAGMAQRIRSMDVEKWK